MKHNSLFKLFLLFSWLISPLTTVHGTEPQRLLFAVNAPGYAPYLYFDFSSQRYEGLVADFFAAQEQQKLFKVEFVDSNQLRSEQFVIEGKVDLYLADRRWLKQSEKVIASVPIVQHLTFLYSLAPFADDFSVETLVNKKICTQHEFVYTGLQSYFDDNKLQRFDSSSQFTIGSMLGKKRCDYAILNHYTATMVFADAEFCQQTIYQSPQPTSIVDLTIIMRPELHQVKSLIDKQLKAFIASGKASQSLLTHSPNPTFPKQASCK